MVVCTDQHLKLTHPGENQSIQNQTVHVASAPEHRLINSFVHSLPSQVVRSTGILRL